MAEKPAGCEKTDCILTQPAETVCPVENCEATTPAECEQPDCPVEPAKNCPETDCPAK